MALVKYGGGIVQMSGSIAGDTHARNRYGNYVRARTKPVNPNSVAQVRIRTILSELAERWSANLTEQQRTDWGIYALNTPMKNKLGETIKLTGFNHYIRSNSSIIYNWATVVDDAPTVFGLPEKDDALAFTSTTIATKQIVLACSDDIWAANGDQLNRIGLLMGVPQGEGRDFFKGPFRALGAITSVEGGAGTATETSPFTFALNHKLWIQARMITLGGRVSEPWIIGPHLVVNGA